MRISSASIRMGLILLIFCVPQLYAANHENQIHIVDPAGNDYVPVSKDKMWQNINEAAIDYQQYAPIPRIAFFDLTYPKDREEYDQLSGYGVLLVTTVSQLHEELPLKNVYVATHDSRVPLKKIGSKRSLIPEQPEIVIKTVGKYREDSLYLFPMYLRAQEGKLTIDFSKNRSGFVLSEFPFEQDELPVMKPSRKVPSEKTLYKVIKREIPIFADIKL